MADFAGLSIAVFDKIWVVGAKAAEIICDYRAFDTTSSELSNQIGVETNRMKTLKCLLFEPSTAYDGKTLFDQFDTNVQIQIHAQLGKTLNILNEAWEILSRQEIDNRRDVLRLDHIHDGLLTDRERSLSPRKSRTMRLRWSLWDKGRLESIIKNFSRENDKVTAQIQLMCHATSIGVTLVHLDRLKTNKHSKELGFDLPAKLQLNATGLEVAIASFQIRDEKLFRNVVSSSKVEGKFAIVDHSVSPLLVEFRSYAVDKSEPVPLQGRTLDRVEKLASLLQQQKDPFFHILQCQGWILNAQENQIAFLFNIPAGTEGKPMSLLKLFESQSHRAALGDRFRLASSLSKSISELQLVKWVHESFRSENVIFFPKTGDPTSKSTREERLDLSQPSVMGFEFNPPEFDFSSGRPDKDVAREIYRHPERQKHPQKLFSKMHDIYALGVVLLEIGLWRPVLSLEKDGFKRVNDPMTIQNYLIKKARKSLPQQMGAHYAGVVVRCLTGDFNVENDNKEDLALQQDFRARVVDVLERAADSIG